MLKISLGVYPHNCHHFGRTKPHEATSHRSTWAAQNHIRCACSIHIRESSHSYFYSVPSEKKWCSTVQNGTSGAHCPGHLHRAHKAQVLGSLPVDALTLPRGRPNCHRACSGSHWSCDTLESCNHLQKCPTEIERRETAEGNWGGEWTPGAVTGEFT